jgi:hypothetical protein
MKIKAALYDCPFETGLWSVKEEGHGRLGGLKAGKHEIKVWPK